MSILGRLGQVVYIPLFLSIFQYSVGYFLFGNYFVVSLIFYLFGSIFLFVFIYDYVAYNSDFFLKSVDYGIPSSSENDLPHTEIIMKRRSNRNYQKRKIEKNHLKEIQGYIDDLVGNYVPLGKKRLRIEIIQAKLWGLWISGATEWFAVIVPKDYDDYVILDVGFLLEKVILKCTRMGIATCWVGGFVPFDVSKSIVSYKKEKDHVAILCPFGYRSKLEPLWTRLFIGGGRYNRKPNDEIFFEDKLGNSLEIENRYKKIFECTRWAPSACNMQMTRVVKIGNKYHFYKDSGISKYYSKMGIGISCANWELACQSENIKGKFVIEDPKLKISKPNQQYFITWVEDVYMFCY